jgi:chromosome segregation ATPase
VKGLLIRLLAALGLVTAGRYRVVADKLRDVEVRAKKLAKLLDQSQADVRAMGTRAQDAAEQLKRVEKDAAHRARETEKQKREVEKLRVEIHRLGTKNDAFEDMRKRLAGAEQGLLIAREQLMMVEVKLDILEGAANVLDGRTRSIVAQPADETSAPV